MFFSEAANFKACFPPVDQEFVRILKMHRQSPNFEQYVLTCEYIVIQLDIEIGTPRMATIRDELERCFDEIDNESYVQNLDPLVRTVFLRALRVGSFCYACLTLHFDTLSLHSVKCQKQREANPGYEAKGVFRNQANRYVCKICRVHFQTVDQALHHVQFEHTLLQKIHAECAKTTAETPPLNQQVLRADIPLEEFEHYSNQLLKNAKKYAKLTNHVRVHFMVRREKIWRIKKMMWLQSRPIAEQIDIYAKTGKTEALMNNMT